MCTGLFHEKFESRFRQWFIGIDPETLQTLLSAFEGQTIRFTKINGVLHYLLKIQQ